MNGWCLDLAPFGVPLRISAERGSDLLAVQAACADWADRPEPSDHPLKLKLCRGDADTGPVEPFIAVSDGSLKMKGSGYEAWASAEAGHARCLLSTNYQVSSGRLRSDWLDTLVLFLVAHHDRVPVHASGFLLGDLALLFAGPSGAGKSGLALAADRLGFPVLSEDMVHVQLAPDFAVWGCPRDVHLMPEDAPPEEVKGKRIRNGRLKLSVSLRSGRAGGAVRAERVAFCLLTPGDAPGLTAITQTEALQRLERLEPGFDLIGDRVEAAHRALARNGAWLFARGPDAQENIRFVAANVERLGRIAGP